MQKKNTKKVNSPAIKSSIIIPKPPLNDLSKKEMGQGFRISKNLKRQKQTKTFKKLNGMKNNGTSIPTISSKTIDE